MAGILGSMFRVCAIALILGSAGAARAADRCEPPRARMEKEISASLDRLRADYADSDQRVDVRDFSNAALASLVVGNDPARAVDFLTPVLAAQNAQTGEIPWVLKGGKQVADANSIEFGTQSWGILLIAYSNRLPASLVATLKRQAAAALPALERHDPPVDYTNIYLLNAVNRLLIAQAVGDGAALDRARARLAAWKNRVSYAGIREFDSPTYYATNLNALAAGYLYAADPSDRALMKDLLDYVWTDIAANTMEGRFVGPRSRDYDFTRGDGSINLYLEAECLQDETRPYRPDIEKIYALIALDPRGYRLPPEIRALAALPKREVLSRWGDRPGQTRTLHIADGVAIGSVAAGDFGTIDKLFTIDFAAGEKEVATVSFITAANDNAYGQPIPDANGRIRRQHLSKGQVAAQRDGWVLGTFDMTSARWVSRDGVTTSLMVPNNADEVRVDGVEVPVDEAAAAVPTPLAEGGIVSLRVGTNCAAVRIIGEHGDAGTDLVADQTGAEQGVMRMRIRHNAADPDLRLAFLAAAAPCGGHLESFEQRVRAVSIDQHFGDQVWVLSAQIDGIPLMLRRDTRSRRFIGLAGAQAPTLDAPLVVNGRSFRP